MIDQNSQLSQIPSMGILGGGQLALMLYEAALKLNIQAHSLVLSEKEPICQTTKAYTVFDPTQPEKSYLEFAQKHLVLTFENEFSDWKLLQQLPQWQKKSRPKMSLMNKLSDRLTQKQLLDQHQISTSPWLQVTEESHQSITQDQLPLVFKKRVGGYDGYGTVICKTTEDLKQFFQKLETKEQNTNTINALSTATDWIAEKFIPFKRELAVTCVRKSANADKPNEDHFFHFPFVESFQKDSKCFWVKGPIEVTHSKPLLNKIQNFLDKIDYIGAITFEIFETHDNELIINEIAPRVHNTGHVTREAYSENQFSAHIKACFNFELRQADFKPLFDFAMVNLIGSKQNLHKKCPEDPTEGFLTWYHKEQEKPGRKMGHISYIGNDANSALQKALELSDSLWYKKL